MSPGGRGTDLRLDGSARIPQCTNLCIENLLIAQPVRACADFQVPTGSSFTQCSGPSDVRVCVVERVRACVNQWGSEKVPRRVRKSQVAVSPSRYESRAVLRSDRSDPKLKGLLTCLITVNMINMLNMPNYH